MVIEGTGSVVEEQLMTDVHSLGEAPVQMRASLLLSAEDLSTWTRIKQKAKLKRWLQAKKIRYLEDAAGWPITTAAAVQEAVAGKTSWAEPNYELLDQWQANKRSKKKDVPVTPTMSR